MIHNTTFTRLFKFIYGMKALVFSLVFFLFLVPQSFSQKIEKIFDSFEEFEPILHQKEDKVYIVNFWATWCMPCIAELPYFEALQAKYPKSELEVILVSLDFKKHIEKKLIPFLEKKKIKSTVYLLDDPKANRWIDKVDPNWSGAIPITLFYSQESRIFKEQEFHSLDELEAIIQTLK